LSHCFIRVGLGAGAGQELAGAAQGVMAAEEIEEALAAVVEAVPGLSGIWVLDRDGIPILGTGQELPAEAAERSIPLEASFALAADQVSKLQLGTCRSITALYQSVVLVLVSAGPMVISLLGDADADPETLVAVAPRVQVALPHPDSTRIIVN
jgi:predicted regulator of Ras-like GTPase activity (Roadblock/LC7/MglB family)